MFSGKIPSYRFAVFGVNKALTLTHSLSNLFWKDLGKATIELLKTCHPKCLCEVLSSPVWYNPKIKIPFRKEWYKNGINMIGDVFGLVSILKL